jgi:predicted membrane channel-forming protein YqfA (hemolysin III family)
MYVHIFLHVYFFVVRYYNIRIAHIYIYKYKYIGEWKPIFHTIWHLFVVLGASLHWFDIYFYVASTAIHPANEKNSTIYQPSSQACLGGYY